MRKAKTEAKTSNVTHKTVERDISWMYFNHRILQEAQKKNVPLLERLSFLGIYSNNLDEFFRVRMATLSRIAESEDKSIKSEADNARDIIKRINKLNTCYSQEYEKTVNEVTDSLCAENICLINENKLSEEQQAYIVSYYREYLNGSTNPVWLSQIDRLTNQTDDSIYLAVKLTHWRGDKKRADKNYALIEIPVNENGRFLRLPDKDGKSFLIYMDDVVRFCLPMIFAGLPYTCFEAYSFKFTKDAEMEMDTDLRNGVLQKVSKGVKSRKRGEPIRVIYDASMPKDLLKKLMEKFRLDKLDTTLPAGRYHNHKDLMSFPDCGRRDLKYPAWKPIYKKEFSDADSFLRLVRTKDCWIHVPYHSFDSYIRLLREAAFNPEVRSIKTTLYRLAKDSKVIKALICAAKNGKKVTVVIELLARFDEASNIDWSKKMQDAGIHVIFGVEGLKVHSKITLITMRVGKLACIGTGNFHEKNARVYTDYLLMTANRPIVKDVEAVFDFVERPYLPAKFKELLVSPNDMKASLIRLIDNEIKNHRQGKPAYIMVKINHVTDPQIVKKLYEASSEGVKIDMVIRGNSSLVTGIDGLSDNIRVAGIIDRYLEHSRILIFANGGEEKYYIGSADWMPRNLDNRIEVMTPVYNPDMQRELKLVITYALRDTMQGVIVDGAGRNLPWTTHEEEKPFRSQEALYEYYKKQEEITIEKKDIKKAESKSAVYTNHEK